MKVNQRKRIFVTATNTDIGKTYTTVKLITELSKQGYKVGVIKPIETGVITHPLDGTILMNTVQKYNKNMKSILIEDIVPIQFVLPAAPYIAKKEKNIEYQKIHNAITKIEKYCGLLIIEGAGGLYVPVDEETMMIDFIEKFNITDTLLVTHGSLGCINDTILSQKALLAKKVKFVTAFNCRDIESFQEVSLPFLKENQKEILIVDKNIDKIIQQLIE